MKTYQAPWSRLLWILSAASVLICLSCAILPWVLPRVPGAAVGRLSVLFLLPLLLVPACALFTVRGYTITADAVLVRRLFWITRLPLSGLRSATHDPGAMRKSVRLCGNGGFFSFTGWYWNSKLRTYRAFVTDPARAVVMRFPTRTIVLSPEDPQAFAAGLEAMTGEGRDVV